MSKRKFAELQNEGSPSHSDFDESSNCSSVMTNSSSDVPTGIVSNKQKKPKKSVQFHDVKVYYFPRSQGFVCVPSEGGSTLGMELKHSHIEDYSVADYAKEQRRLHQRMLEEHRHQGRLMPGLLGKSKVCDKSDDDEDDDEEEEEEEEEDSDFEDLEDYIFLQPISIRQRRTLLRQAGVRKIDIQEKDRCKDIRVSREVCGCDCKVYCDPETCACSVAGIKCQVDRLSFPCGCSKDGCGNTNGRIEFNPIRVRTHFIHTLMRLQLEKREEDSSLYRLQKSSGTKSASDAELGVGLDTSVKLVQAANQDKPKAVDLTEFNSNELGSCRDCQNSEVCNMMMAEVQHASLEAEQQRNVLNNMYQYKDLPQGTVTNPLPHVLLFNDTEDDLYTAQNTTPFYNFKQEDASYSETSECSSDTSTTYENSHYQKSYQTLATPSFEGSLGEEANQEFCHRSNPPNNYIQGTPNEQKYMSLNSSSHMYRVGQVAPPVDSHHNYSTPQTQWATGGGKQAPAPSTYTNTGTSQTSVSGLSSCSYITMTNTTSDQIAETCPSISSLINNVSQGLEYVDQGINNFKPVKEGYGTEQLPSDYSMDCGSTAKVYTDLDSNTPPLKDRTNDQCLLLESAAHTTHKADGEPDKVTTESSRADYSIAPIMENIISSSTSIAQDLSQKFQQNHCVNPTITSTSSSNHRDLLRSKVETGQNFGEIIKESIVETVSA
ncbi:cysteine/serine-rich nuclear protein 3-like [Mizuhopecten yessoensis]|uniref:Cysteine/serine-rich nuclear protein 3 n=1 Tax=Mizuhopecten yessoensis TaxID=6573 RepID=A0A210Q001_MIZYE|nr:cysteine/serine-rich nuclear protein 3-like [Mizuhopecten yessoensis]OWF42084.1 Cysteine/serine-rich nuclear protein 3 [Mizuhopecten yessoensis]